jgi:hypothetical protein
MNAWVIDTKALHIANAFHRVREGRQARSFDAPHKHRRTSTAKRVNKILATTIDLSTRANVTTLRPLTTHSATSRHTTDSSAPPRQDDFGRSRSGVIAHDASADEPRAHDAFVSAPTLQEHYVRSCSGVMRMTHCATSRGHTTTRRRPTLQDDITVVPALE